MVENLARCKRFSQRVVSSSSSDWMCVCVCVLRRKVRKEGLYFILGRLWFMRDVCADDMHELKGPMEGKKIDRSVGWVVHAMRALRGGKGSRGKERMVLTVVRL